jgi:hypothetical protein
VISNRSSNPPAGGLGMQRRSNAIVFVNPSTKARHTGSYPDLSAGLQPSSLSQCSLRWYVS